jgi:hypothetical protein
VAEAAAEEGGEGDGRTVGVEPVMAAERNESKPCALLWVREAEAEEEDEEEGERIASECKAAGGCGDGKN